MDNKKFYKVYEVEDNVSYEAESYPAYFVGAFVDEAAAIELCGVVDIAKCNSTKIVYDEITYSDIEDLKIYGLEAADEEALNQMSSMLEAQAENDKSNQPE